MIKKYGSKIFTSVSFTGIAISNVKAANNNQKVHLKVGNNVYWKTGNATTDIKDVNSLEKLFELISSFGEIKKDGIDEATKLNFSDSKKNYFIKEVKVSGSEDNKLNDKLEINISAAEGDVEITLVPKRECIEFKYKGDKQLTKAAEDELLKKVIQGAEVGSIDVIDVLSARNSKLGEKVINGGDIIGIDGLKLDENNKLEFEINQGEIDPKALKKVVCKFEPNVEKLLVAGVDLEKLCDAVDITKNGAELSAIKTALNDVQVEGSNKGIFKSDAGLSILPDGDNGKKLVEGNVKIPDKCSFIVIDGIIKDDINPIFLKKTFKVEFDNTGNEDKKVDDGILKTIENNLKTHFGDNVEITVQQIIENIKSISDASTIFKSSPFTDLKNVNITGVTRKSPDSLANDDTVNSAEIKISIKEAEFAQGVVTIKLKLKVAFNDTTKDNKTLKSNVKGAIENIIRCITTKISISEFVKKFNDDTTIARGDGKQFDKNDFNFGTTLEKNDITKNGTIMLVDTFFGKLKDDCFEAHAKPKGGEESGSSNGDEQKGDDKKEGEKGYSGSSKKNK